MRYLPVASGQVFKQRHRRSEPLSAAWGLHHICCCSCVTARRLSTDILLQPGRLLVHREERLSPPKNRWSFTDGRGFTQGSSRSIVCIFGSYIFYKGCQFCLHRGEANAPQEQDEMQVQKAAASFTGSVRLASLVWRRDTFFVVHFVELFLIPIWCVFPLKCADCVLQHIYHTNGADHSDANE